MEEYSERTAKEILSCFRRWFSTRIKSYEEGTKITVFVLCTADFSTAGRTYQWRSIKNKMKKAVEYLVGKVVEAFIGLLFVSKAIEFQVILRVKV